MRIPFLIQLICFFSLSILAAEKQPTTDSLLARYVEAIGGKDAWNKVESRSIKADLEIFGSSTEWTLRAKAPNKRRTEVDLGPLGLAIDGFDGTTAWSKNQSGIKNKEGDELSRAIREADFRREIRLKELYPDLTLKGTESFGGEKVHVLESQPTATSKERFSFSAQSGLLVRQQAESKTADGVELGLDIGYSDYRDVDGLKYPHSQKVTISADGQEVLNFELKVKEIKHNEKFDDAIFARPREADGASTTSDPASERTAKVEPAAYTRTEDVIYGRKHGLALTMDVFAPKENANGCGIIFCVSGGWFSAKESINPIFVTEFLNRGYTVFTVVHGSQPKFTIPEVLEDMHRAVRFIRANAKKYNIDPDKLGITGASAGGHLSLMQGTAPRPGNPDAKDPVERESSKVAAVGCFFPPTDFLNYGEEGVVALGTGILKDFRAPFDFHEFDSKSRSYVPVTDEAKRRKIGRQISPVYSVTKDDVPTLIFHGDADRLVPIQQAERMVAELKEAGVPAELIVREGRGHGWPEMGKDLAKLAEWFDAQLLGKK